MSTKLINNKSVKKNIFIIGRFLYTKKAINVSEQYLIISRIFIDNELLKLTNISIYIGLVD